MINSRVNSAPVRSRISGSSTNSRTSSLNSGFITTYETSGTLAAGSPIGLLLALTYATGDVVITATTTLFGDFRPNSRVA